MSKQLISGIKERDAVNAVFLLKEKIMAMAKNGKPYMNLRLMDKSGEIEAKIWDNADELDREFAKDDFVQVTGKASVYMNKMQVVISGIKKIAEADIDLADFLPVSPRSADEMSAELHQVISEIKNPYLKALMESFTGDPAFLKLYTTAPAAKSMHHVYIGGLLEHSLAIVKLVKSMAPLYEGINEDLLMAGALLHDVGKIEEMSFERTIEYTDEGKLLGHITIGVELIDHKIREIERFPRELAILLKHMILSHHGQYEYGSPKRPKTIEATILNYLDDMDSKINGIKTHIEKENASSSRWTAYHKLYDRYFFKSNGTDEELEINSSEKQREEDLRKTPPVQAANITGEGKKEKPRFANQPLKALENLDLF